MTTELLTVLVTHNERWPRRGYMFVPTFLLSAGDRIRFDWNPTEKGRSLAIVIERTDSRADVSPNAVPIAEFAVQDVIDFTIPADSLYNVLIENPAFDEGPAGQLRIVRTCFPSQNCERSPFPERYYDYRLTYENGVYAKQCTDWGYRTDLGAMIIRPYTGDVPLHQLFDSGTMAFDAVEYTSEQIKKVLFLLVSKGVTVVVRLTQRQLDNEFVVTEIRKQGSGQLYGHMGESSYVVANEDCILQIESFVYNRFGDTTDLPTDFITIRTYSDTPSGARLLGESHRLLHVFNEVFNQYELEPVTPVERWVTGNNRDTPEQSG